MREGELGGGLRSRGLWGRNGAVGSSGVHDVDMRECGALRCHVRFGARQVMERRHTLVVLWATFRERNGSGADGCWEDVGGCVGVS